MVRDYKHKMIIYGSLEKWKMQRLTSHKWNFITPARCFLKADSQPLLNLVMKQQDDFLCRLVGKRFTV